jgi:hypothetical protein
MAVRNPRNLIYVIRCRGDRCGLVGLSDVDTVDGVAMVWYALGDRMRISLIVISHFALS